MTAWAAAGIAVAAVVAVTVVGLLLQTFLPTNAVAFLLYVPPILVAALVGGFWTTMLATILGGVGAEFFFRRPYFTMPDGISELYPLSLYLTIGVGVGLLAGRLARMRTDVQRREREFQTLFNLTPIGIGIALDPACERISVNPAFAELLRIARDGNASLSAPAGERPPFTVLRDGAPIPSEELPLQKAARLGREVRDIELDVVHADGSTVSLYEYAAPLFDDDGKVRGAIGAFLDITERKRVEASLRRVVEENERLAHRAQEASRLKDEFLATLSHELRTPLNALLGWIQLVRSGQLSPAKHERALAAIERSAQLQAQLTSDLLDVSGAITGKLRLMLEPVLVAPLVEDVLDSLRSVGEGKGVRVSASVDVSSTLLLDGARVQQILWNLVSNAIKFTPKDGCVDVQVSATDGTLVISVSDTGIGIAPAFLPHVFDRFRQADAGTTRVHGGLGLGLAIVKRLAEMHGGTAVAHSDGEGRGATFIVSMPVRGI